MSTEDVLDILGIDAADRDGCRTLLAERSDDPAVLEAIASIQRSFGSFNEIPVRETTQEELVWLTAYLLLTPTVVAWHRENDIPERVMRDTLADVGRHVAISRRVTGEFSLQTWRWLLHHFTVRIFALGRLQFALQRATLSVPDVFAAGDWVLAVHIPESGPLTPAVVDASLAEAKRFFPEHFPERPVRVVTCDSWMLDPFLLERTTPTSNIGAFIRRFTPIGHFSVGHTDALYFVFRTRDLDLVPSLPRETSLQRAVIERLELGQSWEVHWGYLVL
ncbi:acyltransferase domain-containing protein [Glaciihabitans sp. dw_435]|uniref:acyltransferase domain-containing protein n=1 Tax=Glaciihabitans sp. dw_435 TaxID=2720081 RepID=UPI001BD20F84|nr:acyltransferase domain-containing protein [Glaciihabitans sp. dw_435]